MNERLREFERFPRDRVLRSVRRWVPYVVIAALVGAAIAFGISKVIASQYKAAAQLYITPAAGDTNLLQDVLGGQNLAQSYVQLAGTEVVLRPAMESLGMTDFRRFRDRTAVSVVRNTSVIVIAFQDEDPQIAADGANAIATFFVNRSRSLTQKTSASDTDLSDQIRAAQADLRSLDETLSSLRAQLNASPRPGQTATARPDLSTQLAQLEAARQLRQETLSQLTKTQFDAQTTAARASNSLTIWQPATPPLEADSPHTTLNTLFGLMAAGLGAFMVVAVRGYLDDRFRDLDEIRAVLGVPAYGVVSLSDEPQTTRGKLFTRDHPKSIEAEEFRSIRTNLMFADVDRKPRSLVITSAQPFEGKSIVAANLALAFAAAGTPTILVDADLRRPAQARLFGLDSRTGLTNMLAGTVPTSAATDFKVTQQLIVIPAGPLVVNPTELLSSAQMSKVIADLTRLNTNAIVLIDTTPVLAIADALALATKAEGVLLVVDSLRTRTSTARQAMQALRGVHANVLGAVLNKVPTGQGYDVYQYTERARPAQPPASRRSAARVVSTEAPRTTK